MVYVQIYCKRLQATHTISDINKLVNSSYITYFKFSQLIIDVTSVLGPLHGVVVGGFADVSKVHVVSICRPKRLRS
jgi:hypothetical protein